MTCISKRIAISIAAIVGLAVTALAQGQQTATTKTSVQAAQERLQELGYELGSADGNIGPRTASALKKFQSDHSLPVTGTFDQKTLDTLNTAHATAKAQSAKDGSPVRSAGKDTKNTIRGTVESTGVAVDDRGSPLPFITMEGDPRTFTFTPVQGRTFGMVEGASTLINAKGWNVEIVFQGAGDDAYIIKSFKRLN